MAPIIRVRVLTPDKGKGSQYILRLTATGITHDIYAEKGAMVEMDEHWHRRTR